MCFLYMKQISLYCIISSFFFSFIFVYEQSPKRIVKNRAATLLHEYYISVVEKIQFKFQPKGTIWEPLVFIFFICVYVISGRRANGEWRGRSFIKYISVTGAGGGGGTSVSHACTACDHLGRSDVNIKISDDDDSRVRKEGIKFISSSSANRRDYYFRTLNENDCCCCCCFAVGENDRVYYLFCSSQFFQI